MLGDHYPVSVTFQIGSRKPTGIEKISESKIQVTNYYNLNGQRVDSHTHGIVIERSGEKTHKRIIK